MFKTFILIVVTITLAGCQTENEDADVQAVEYINPGQSFSEVVRVGNTLYLTGKLGFIPGEGLAPGGIQEETRQTLENIKTVLESNGSSLDRVVKCTVFLADIGEWAQMNEVYQTFFPSNPPARSAVGVSGLARGARVEIECIATVSGEEEDGH